MSLFTLGMIYYEFIRQLFSHKSIGHTHVLSICTLITGENTMYRMNVPYSLHRVFFFFFFCFVLFLYFIAKYLPPASVATYMFKYHQNYRCL